MLAKLAFKISANRRFRTFLGVLSTIGTAALFIALSLNQGIEQPKTQLSSKTALNQIKFDPI
jgi:hypothetical protein